MIRNQVRFHHPKPALLGVILLILTGLACVFYYTYLNIRHDMDLITAKQDNVFEVFYQRAKILKVENITHYLEQHHALEQGNPKSEEGTNYLYGYDIESKARFADIPLQYPAANILNTFRYALSYPEVINIYTIWNDYRLLGMVANDDVLPTKLTPIGSNMRAFAPWHHYFGCTDFITKHKLCSKDEAFVSDIEVDSFTLRNTIVMFFPFVLEQKRSDAKYGLLGIDIAVDKAFEDVLRPFNELNPTRTAISFDAAKPCPARHICLSQPFMRTKAGTILYLKWAYSWLDFTKVTLHSAAFKVYLILLLLVMVIGKQLYQRVRTLAYTDQLTRLPRRDVLNPARLHEHDYLMLLDIDNFKSINDIYGHNAGDQALAAFARHLEDNTRKIDSAIRWGGEEFIVLFKGMGDDDMMRHSAARLLAKPLAIPALPPPITFSAGIIRIRDYLTVSEAVHLADELLYHVKQHGKHNIAWYEGQEIRLIREPSAQPASADEAALLPSRPL
ncbi:GGDEF domain-containing protein [Aeromonas enteropelogenes]|uniref:diguanylate cyclase n=1 Tax=Aeromonas enteropelogenes TaxID=29489 RepID=A0A175VIS4_AEREN|nr:GGDEF domain-containing protein [Aeromonas enteropelogenes]KXU80369.1 diguanylate cyclase [Aeromonas enteropelogenes]